MKNLQLSDIAFSEESRYRWMRHSIFWLGVFFYHLVRVGLMFPLKNPGPEALSILEVTLFNGMLLNMLCSYVVVYLLIPRYFNTRKYIQFAILVVALFFFMELIVALHEFFINRRAEEAIGIDPRK